MPLQLIGICQDTKTDGTKAGLTFQMRDIFAYSSAKSSAAGGGAFVTAMNGSVNTSSGGWRSCPMRSYLKDAFEPLLDEAVRSAIASVTKCQGLSNGTVDPTTKTSLQITAGEAIWLPSVYEVWGTGTDGNYAVTEKRTDITGYTPFQYQAYQRSSGSSINVTAIKTFNGTPRDWWLRSATSIHTVRFGRMISNGGQGSLDSVEKAGGVAPAFCL